jgi:hypothetical protein
MGLTAPACLAQSQPIARVAQTPQSPQYQPPTQPNEPPAAEAPATPSPNPAPGGVPYSDVATPAAPGGDNALDFFSPSSGGVAPSTAVAAANSTLGGGGGYIENAIPRTQFRNRYDVAGGVSHPDRAAWFWPAYGPGFKGGQFSYQELTTHLEYAPTANFSAFIDAPERFVHLPQGRGVPSINYGGFSDLQLGAKYAFIARPDAFATFQFKTYVPTGNATQGLGTGHVSIEPSLLLFRQVSERGFLIAQLSDWIPTGSLNIPRTATSGTSESMDVLNYGGNVLNYGVGGFYNVIQTPGYRLAPVVEVVGWTALSGRTGIANTSEASAGQTIVNAKIGARIGIGDYFRNGGASPLNDKVSLYAGYGRSLTGDVWYTNIFRLELVVYF